MSTDVVDKVNKNMRACQHKSVQIVNWYESVPKYECDACGNILICECEKDRSARLLPHQTSFAGGPGFWRVAVDGYARDLCHFCRRIPLPPAPRAVLPNQKGKVQRYYWREIQRTMNETLVAWMISKGLEFDIIQLRSEYPTVVKEAECEARVLWQQIHKKSPLYTTKELSQEEFLDQVPIPVSEVKAPHTICTEKNGAPVGWFQLPNGKYVRVEKMAQYHFEEQGWQVLECERRLITALYSVLLGSVVMNDERVHLREGARGSTNPDRAGEIISMTLPDDFGTPANFARRDVEYEKIIRKLQGADLKKVFREQIRNTEMLRDYLSVHDPEIELALHALGVISGSDICEMLRWVVQDFWSRQHGWPDLILLRGEVFQFVEVKSRKDRLSQSQMAWFEWAAAHAIPCSLLKILPT